MFHVHSSCISNVKNIKDNIQLKEESVVNTELSLKVKRVMLTIFSIDLVQYETQHLHFKMFLTIYMHQFEWLSERGGNFLICFRKRGFPQKRRGSPTLGETMLLLLQCLCLIDECIQRGFASSQPVWDPKFLYQIKKD